MKNNYFRIYIFITNFELEMKSNLLVFKIVRIPLNENYGVPRFGWTK